MKSIFGAGVAALVIFGTAGSAFSADLPGRPYEPPQVMPVPVVAGWSGAYVGVHIGWGSADKDWAQTSPAAFAAGGNSASFTADGIIGGGQIGYNWQMGNWVFGGEVDISGSGMSGDATQSFTPTWRSNTHINWLGTVTGRVGMVWDRVLLYAKGGFAWADEDHFQQFTPAGGVATEVSRINNTHTGWIVGAGVEVALWANWTGKIEYNYVDLGTETGLTFTNAAPAPGARATDIWSIDQQIHMVKFGANYHFHY
jgi:outer membrane immunogenic protein